MLIICGLAHIYTQEFVEEIKEWSSILNLHISEDYLQNIAEKPMYITICTILISLYIITCLAYVYGAYLCNNVLMITYILVELLRLIILSMLTATYLLLLKQSSMDLGVLIGASVASGFFLLGMFYLWICAANLPILIVEMERDEQNEKINKLQKIIESENQNTNLDEFEHMPYHVGIQDIPNRNVFFVSSNKFPIHYRNSVEFNS